MVLARSHRLGLGGTSAGKALGLARLGIRTTLRTVIGTDDDAALILTALDHPLLTVRANRDLLGPSEHHLNLMSADGGRVSIYLDLPGPPPAPARDILATLADTDIAVIDLAESSLPMLTAARDAGSQIWCDIHDYDGAADFHRPFIDAADVLMVSADRLPDPQRFLVDAVEDRCVTRRLHRRRAWCDSAVRHGGRLRRRRVRRADRGGHQRRRGRLLRRPAGRAGGGPTAGRSVALGGGRRGAGGAVARPGRAEPVPGGGALAPGTQDSMIPARRRS